MRKIIQLAVNTVIIGLITIALMEIVLVYSFNSPGISILPLDVMRSIYVRELRNTFQFSRSCSIYDNELFYTLKPGNCIYENLEYSTRYEINSAGLRDDEKSLTAPEIVVLGDSHAMGWGVETDETFAHQVEMITGRTTLNAGVSSYGTAREMRLLERRINMDNIKYLVIQYSDNDIKENASLYRNGGLTISKEEKWEELAKQEERRGGYYPGRYSLVAVYYLMQWFTGSKMFENNMENGKVGKGDNEELSEHELFLNAIKTSNLKLQGIKIIILELNGHNNNDSEFITGVEKLINSDDDELFRNNKFYFLDTSKILKDEHFYRIDDHMRPEGHRVVSESLAKLLH